MIRIAHLADIHIKNSSFHKIYRECFERTFEQLREDKVDLIFVLGDIAHTKLNLSAEFFEMSHFFFSGLSKIAPVYTILGNHDANLSNLNRQDAVSPMIKAMNNENVHLMKYTGVYKVDGFPIDICHYSVFDTHNWPENSFNTDPNNISICMYHGPLNGCMTDVGHKMDYKIDASLFSPYDFTMLGDIHKCQPMDSDCRVWYAGSLIQQNYGESYDKGYLLWEIENRNKWNVTRRIVNNESPFVNVILEDRKINTDHPDPPKGSHVRVVIKDDLSTKEINDILNPFLEKIEPKERRIRKAFGSSKGIENVRTSDDFRSVSVQSKLLREFCEERGAKEDVIKRVLGLNSIICNSISDNEILRNSIFDIEKLEWSNVFSYGQNNSFNLSDVNGLIGIFGSNASGKSSIIDSMLFSMFNRVSRKIPSIGNIINNNTKNANTEITLKSGSQRYKIYRDAVWKKVKDVERGSCTVSVDFFEDQAGSGFVKNNGKSRQDTDSSVIRSKIGDFDDYITTSISPQGDVSRFLELGPSERKDYLIKILDVAFFDTAFEIAKEQSKPFKARIMTLGSLAEIEGKICSHKSEIDQFEKDIIELDSKIIAATDNESHLKDEKLKIQEKLNIAGSPKFDMETCDRNVNSLVDKISKSNSNIESLEESIHTLSTEINSLKKEIDKIEVVEQDEIDKCVDEINDLKAIISKRESIESKISDCKKSSKLLENVPCDDQFPKCPLIAHAHDARSMAEALQNDLESLGDIDEVRDNLSLFKSLLGTLQEAKANLDTKQRLLQQKENKIQNQKSELALERERIENFTIKLKDAKSELESALQEKEIVNNILSIRREFDLASSNVNLATKKKNELLALKDDLIRVMSKSSAKIDLLESQKNDLTEALIEYEAFEYLISGLSRNGIVQNILMQMQDSINSEIQDILGDIVPFTVSFDLSDPSCKIYIEYPNQEKRYLELASGMEKMVSSLAIRVALIQLSSLPKLSTLIIDEGFGVLDSDNIFYMSKILESLKSKFKNIIIISHIDSIKDMVDHSFSVNIDENGFSNFNN